MKILIVDDNANMRRVLKSLLADGETELVECEDGVGAITAYLQFRPDLVLMHVEMEGGEEFAAISELANAFPEARIMIVIHSDEPYLRATAANAGACAYVIKGELLETHKRLKSPIQIRT